MRKQQILLSAIWLSALTFLPNRAQAQVEAEVILRGPNGFQFNGNELVIDNLQPGQPFSVDLLVRTSPGTPDFNNVSYMQLDLRSSDRVGADPQVNCEEPGLLVCPRFNPNEVMGNPYLSWAGQQGSEGICGDEFNDWIDENGDGYPEAAGPFCNYTASAGFDSIDTVYGIVTASFRPVPFPWFPYFGVGEGMDIVEFTGASNYNDLADAKLLATFDLVFQGDADNNGVFNVCGIVPANGSQITSDGIMFMSEMYDGTFRWLTEYPNSPNVEGYNPDYRQIDCSLGRVVLRGAQAPQPIALDVDNQNYRSYSYPYHGAIDARRPKNPDTNEAEGWTTIDLRFTGPAQSATCNSPASCEEIYLVAQEHRVEYHPCPLGAAADAICIEPVPHVVSAQIITDSLVGGVTSNNTVRVTLNKRVSPLTLTKIAHRPSQTSTRLASLPGDVDANGWSNMRDIRALGNYALGTCASALEIWQYDIDRNGIFEYIKPDRRSGDYAMLLEILHVLNSVPGYQNWAGARLPIAPMY